MIPYCGNNLFFIFISFHIKFRKFYSLPPMDVWSHKNSQEGTPLLRDDFIVGVTVIIGHELRISCRRHPGTISSCR